MENQKKMQFYGGTFGACLPLLVFMALMITIAALQKVSLVLFCMAGFAGLCTAFLLAKDKKEFEKAVVAGLKNDTLCVIIFAFLLAGVLSQELRQSGLIQGLTWLVTELGLSAGFLPLVGFIICALISTACGTSNGAIVAVLPVLLPVATTVGANPAVVVGAIVSGAIFGDNLAPVSDVTVISSVTQRFRDGTPADIAGVVRTRLPYAMTALAVSMPVYAFMGASRPVSEAALSGDASALLMLVPVAVLIAVAVRTRDVLMAISAGAVTGTATGLLIGRLSFATIFAADDGRLSGFLISGISNVSPIILLCVTLFAFTGIVREAGVPDMMAKALEAGSAGRPSALRTELFLSAATLVVTTLFAAVTSASVALVGSLTDDIGRASNVHPYRRSHILSGLANSLPVLMPFSAFVLITMAAVSGLEGAAAVTPFTLMTAAFYPIALFLVFGFMVLTGTGRMMETPEPEAAEAKTATAL